MKVIEPLEYNIVIKKTTGELSKFVFGILSMTIEYEHHLHYIDVIEAEFEPNKEVYSRYDFDKYLDVEKMWITDFYTWNEYEFNQNQIFTADAMDIIYNAVKSKQIWINVELSD